MFLLSCFTKKQGSPSSIWCIVGNYRTCKTSKDFCAHCASHGPSAHQAKEQAICRETAATYVASMLAANRSANLGHQQTLSNAATRLAESDSKLPAALHHSASASRLVPLSGSVSQIQASSGQARCLNVNSDYNKQHNMHMKATALHCLFASFPLL